MKHLKIGDIILIFAILLSALLIFILPLLSDKAENAEIVIVETDSRQTISLKKDAEYDISSNGVTLKVTVKDGKIFVSESDCKDSVCKNTPPISRSGQTIVCAPAGVIIRILGEGGEVDGVAG